MIGNVVTNWNEQEYGEELNHRVQLDELERLEGGCHGSSTFSQESNNAIYVLNCTGERRCNRCFCLWQTNSNISCFQCAAVVCAITAHANLLLQNGLHLFHQTRFVVGTHSSKHLCLSNHTIEHEGVFGAHTNDMFKRVSRDCYFDVLVKVAPRELTGWGTFELLVDFKTCRLPHHDLLTVDVCYVS